MSTAAPEDERQLVGVRGWLLFRVILWTVISPTWLAFTLRHGFHTDIDWLDLVQISLGLVCAVLVIRRQAKALPFIALFLVFQFLYAIYYIYMDVTSHRFKHLGGIMTIIGLDMAMYIAWFLYFCYSVRVRNTLGRNL